MGFREAGQHVGGGDKFVKWLKPGQTLTGLIEAVKPENKFGKPEVALIVNGEEKVVALNYDLNARFCAAFGSLARVPKGVSVRITFLEAKPVGQAQPLKVFRLEVDDSTLPAGFNLDPEPDADEDNPGGY